MDRFSVILEQPVQSEDPDDWSMRMEVGVLLGQNLCQQAFINCLSIRIKYCIRMLVLSFSLGFEVFESVCSEHSELY